MNPAKSSSNSVNLLLPHEFGFTRLKLEILGEHPLQRLLAGTVCIVKHKLGHIWWILPIFVRL